MVEYGKQESGQELVSQHRRAWTVLAQTPCPCIIREIPGAVPLLSSIPRYCALGDAGFDMDTKALGGYRGRFMVRSLRIGEIIKARFRRNPGDDRELCQIPVHIGV